MKAQPLCLVDGNFRRCDPKDATHICILIPVTFPPLQRRIIPVQISGKREGTQNWTWNGDTESPTLRPSIKKNWQCGDGEGNPGPDILCHTWITDGYAHFLEDSTHSCAGHTLPLLNIAEDTWPPRTTKAIA